jgi:hypothetical protein
MCLRPLQGKRVGVFKDDMYVELRVVGMPHDTATESSPHQNNTGRLVVDQDFSFPVKFPEMAVLLVLLKDQDSVMADTILGYTGLPLANLAPGRSSEWYTVVCRTQPSPARLYTHALLLLKMTSAVRCTHQNIFSTQGCKGGVLLRILAMVHCLGGQDCYTYTFAHNKSSLPTRITTDFQRPLFCCVIQIDLSTQGGMGGALLKVLALMHCFAAQVPTSCRWLSPKSWAGRRTTQACGSSCSWDGSKTHHRAQQSRQRMLLRRRCLLQRLPLHRFRALLLARARVGGVYMMVWVVFWVFKGGAILNGRVNIWFASASWQPKRLAQGS